MRRANAILLILFCIVLVSGSVGLTLFPAARYAEGENRYLAEFPTVTATGIADGSVTAALDTYATERAPFRGICRLVWGATELSLGKRESHGVILCRDGSLSRRLACDEALLARNLSVLPRMRAALGEKPLTLAVVPRRIDARREVLPALYDSSTSLAAYDLLPSEAVTFPECREDADWFRTDHHWTAAGAYKAYLRLGEVLGYTPLAEGEFTVETVSESFLGTSHAAAGLPFISPDRILLWRSADDNTFTVTRDGRAADFTGLYDLQKLQTHDGYAVFLGGNCGVLEITKGEEDARPVLLVIKDSFANALLPFLARHYRVIAIDPRYRAAGLTSLAERADLSLVLCGMQTIGAEPFLTPLSR